MMKRSWRYRSLVLCCMLIVQTLSLHSQNVSVTLLPPPPNQMHLSDLWRILLFNNDNTTYQIHLHATAYVGFDRSGKLIADAQSRVMDLPSSPAPQRMNGTMVQPVKVNKSDPKYEAVIRSTGTVPSGDYFFCIEIVEERSGAVLAEACMQHSVENLSPPILVFPQDESVVEERQPTFTWLAPSPLKAASQPRYRLRIVDVIGDQTPQQAMQSNRSWFERSDIYTTLFVYPFSARPFAEKKQYAWQIFAFDAGSTAPFGESEVWSFTAKDSIKKTTSADSIINPITDGYLSAGDQFGMGVFETKAEQRLSLTRLKASVATEGQVKTSLGAGSDFNGAVIDKNLNASEMYKVSSTEQNGNIVLNKNQYASAQSAVKRVTGKLDDIVAKPSIEHMLWTWGRNVEGEIGFLGPAWYSDSPLPYDIENIQQIACGAEHTLMLLKDGTVLAWGDNQFGQLANSSLRESNVGLPVAFPGKNKIIQVAAGLATSFALREDGFLFAWGYNAGGELGNPLDTSHERSSPAHINPDGVRFSSVAARGGHALAIATDGSVYAWGSNYYGEVGNGLAHVRIPLPMPVLSADQVKDKIVMTSNGSSGLVEAQKLLSSKNVSSFRAIACGDHSSYAVGSGGNDVFSWGRNASGQLMDGTTKDTASPVRLSLSSVDSIAAGGSHVLVHMKDLTLRVAGNNMAGQLGESKLGCSNTAHPLSGFGQVLALSAGASHSMMIKKSGGLWTVGLNNAGQLAQSPIFDIIYTNKPARAPARIVSLEQ